MKYTEMGKGIFTFFFGLLFFFYAWFIFSALLNYAVSVDPYLGAFSWVMFAIQFLLTVFVYPGYAIICAYNDKETKLKSILLGSLFWAIGTIACIIIFVIGSALINGLPTLTIDVTNMGGTTNTVDATADLTMVQAMSYLAMLVLYFMYLIFLPFRLIIEGFIGDVK